MRECDPFPRPLFTPSTKAAAGEHDANISVREAAALIGADRARAVQQVALALYTRAAAMAAERGLIIADTKFEFGLDRDGRLVLADEVLTPDSSRLWSRATYAPGRAQDSFDKQYVRDYLESIGFDKRTPVALPDAVVARTLDKYCEAFERLTGRSRTELAL